MQKQWELILDEKEQKTSRERVPHVLSQYTQFLLFVFLFSLLPYGSITILLIHSYGFAVYASKIMFG